MDRLRELVERLERMAYDYEDDGEMGAAAAMHRAADEVEAALPRWIPVSERLPNADVRVWAYCAGEKRAEIGRRIPNEPNVEGFPAFWDDNNAWLGVVTHWTPLPSPPEGE